MVQALRHLLKSQAGIYEDQAIELAIECIGKARSDALTHQLIDFLMGDPDGIPKVWQEHIYLHNL